MKRAALLLLAIVAGCPTELTPDPLPEYDPAGLDAGDEAWVRSATLLMWGRRAGSVDELRVLVDLVQSAQRGDAIAAMARSDEYVERWTDQIYDLMNVARLGDQENAPCYAVSGDDPSVELARHVRDEGPAGDPFPGDWTMLDLVRSSLLLDDVSIPYRAHLFGNTFVDFQIPTATGDQSLSESQAEAFESVYLNRSPTCIGCHNSEASVVDHEDPVLDRHWPIEARFEQALFGGPDIAPAGDLAVFFRRYGVQHGYRFGFQFPEPLPEDIVRVDGCRLLSPMLGCAGCPCEETVCAQFPECCLEGWTTHCVEACRASGDGCINPVPDDFDGCGAVHGEQIGGCGGCACEEEVCATRPWCCGDEWEEECAITCSDITGCERTPASETEGLRPWGMHPACLSFEPPERVEPGLAGDVGRFGGAEGDSVSLYELEAMLRRGVQQLSDGLDVADDGTVGGDEAFAYLLALNVVDQVWMEAFGARLTMPNRFPRNRPQRDRLAALADDFVTSGFSLVGLLQDIALHPAFNQAAAPDWPADRSPYSLDPLFDPYSVEAVEPVERPNSGADTVRRLDARVLRSALGSALEWEVGSPVFPSNHEIAAGGRLEEAIGTFVRHAQPGYEGIDFVGLLGWEDAVAGCRDPRDRPVQSYCRVRDTPGCVGCRCSEDLVCGVPGLEHCCSESWDEACVEQCRQLSGCAADRPEDWVFAEDWLDRLVGAAQDRAEAGDPPSWGDLAGALKERMILDPDVSDPDERGLLSDLLGVDLEAAVTGEDDLDAPLRRLCTALATTPQFLLAGVPAAPVGEGSTLYPPGADYRTSCERLGPLFGDVTCEDDSLTLR